MRWWFPKKFRPPEIDKNGRRIAAENLRESQKKLRDTVKETERVDRVSEKTRELTGRDAFAEALEKAMRRANG